MYDFCDFVPCADVSPSENMHKMKIYADAEKGAARHTAAISFEKERTVLQKFVINGGRRPDGEIILQGAKNSVLPLMAASVLCGGKIYLGNCPCITDRYSSMRILNCLGCKAIGKGGFTEIDSSGKFSYDNKIDLSGIFKRRSILKLIENDYRPDVCI